MIQTNFPGKSRLHAIILFAFSEDILCIKEQGDSPILSNSKYPEGLIIPLLSLTLFVEIIWNHLISNWHHLKSIPLSYLDGTMSSSQSILQLLKIPVSLKMTFYICHKVEMFQREDDSVPAR